MRSQRSTGHAVEQALGDDAGHRLGAQQRVAAGDGGVGDHRRVTRSPSTIVSLADARDVAVELERRACRGASSVTKRARSPVATALTTGAGVADAVRGRDPAVLERDAARALDVQRAARRGAGARWKRRS